MLSAERESHILRELRSRGAVAIDSIAESLGVSTMTVRRDLDRLEQKGLLQRTHGGALVPSLLHREEPYSEKARHNTDVKRAMALRAKTFVRKGDTVILDAGTSTLALARELALLEEITVVTNDLAISLALCDSRVRIFMPGGEVQKETGSLLGTATESFFENIRADIAFIGTSGVAEDGGIYTPTMEKAALKRRMMKCARRTVLLADSSKFFLDGFVRICGLGDFSDLISDRIFTEDQKAGLAAQGLEIHGISNDSEVSHA